MIGREDLLEALRAELARSRLVTLIGPGGVGKTAVAYELARSVESRYRDGVLPVEFVSVSDAGATIDALATALDVQTRRDASLEDAVVNVLRPRHALLLLDNCEHLIEPLAAIVDRILRAAPEVSILSTSRQPLAVRGEHLRPIEPLPAGADDDPTSLRYLRAVPAVALFADRASAADPGFALDESTADLVARICRRLDGMPLAIELAAARVRTLGVVEIERRLDARFFLLRGVRRGADPRHQTLQDTVRWSFDLLSPEEQALFSELSVFAGQFELVAAASVCGPRDELETLDLVARLAERSMLTVRRPNAGESRYEMLETLRDYGRSRLDDAARASLATRHSGYYAALARVVALGALGKAELATQVIGAVERRATMGTPPVIAYLRDRALATANDLRARLGAERYAALHAAGAALPVTDVVHRTRAALLGH